VSNVKLLEGIVEMIMEEELELDWRDDIACSICCISEDGGHGAWKILELLFGDIRRYNDE